MEAVARGHLRGPLLLTLPLLTLPLLTLPLLTLPLGSGVCSDLWGQPWASILRA
jgi:hypothetical protein